MSWLKITSQVLVLLALCAAGTNGRAEKSADKAEQLRRLKMTDIEKQVHSPFAQRETKAAVLIFISTDCPIANAFQPSLRELQASYRDRGVACFMLHCSSKVTIDEARKHVKDYEIKMPVVIDSSQKLGKLTGAKVTPEAIVIDRSGAIRYRGLINDLYAGYGKKRRTPSKHYLRDAIDSVITGKDVATKVTKPVGCYIHFEGAQGKLNR